MWSDNQWIVSSVAMATQHIFDIKFGMLQVRENAILLRKWSDGTVQLGIWEGTLVLHPTLWKRNFSWLRVSVKELPQYLQVFFISVAVGNDIRPLKASSCGKLA